MSDMFVTIHGDSWKFQDVQEPVDWARSQTWIKTLWSAVPHNDDHDHCQICWWKLKASNDPSIGEGYINENRCWLCTECFDQFVGPAQ